MLSFRANRGISLRLPRQLRFTRALRCKSERPFCICSGRLSGGRFSPCVLRRYASRSRRHGRYSLALVAAASLLRRPHLHLHQPEDGVSRTVLNSGKKQRHKHSMRGMGELGGKGVPSAIPAEEPQAMIGISAEFCSSDASNSTVSDVTVRWPFFVFSTTHGHKQKARALDTPNAPQFKYCRILQMELIPLTKSPDRVL